VFPSHVPFPCPPRPRPPPTQPHNSSTSNAQSSMHCMHRSSIFASDAFCLSAQPAAYEVGFPLATVYPINSSLHRCSKKRHAC
jgi:hypothetical protein